jgi:hypothetical protein
MDLMGLPTGIHTNTHCVVDKDYRLRTFRFKMSSGVIEYALSGSVEGGFLNIKTGEKKGAARHRIPLETPPVLGAGLAYYFSERPVSVGDSYSLPLFDPSSMSQKTARMRVTGLEEVTIKGISYEAFRIETELWGHEMVLWLDREGRTLKESGFMGLTAVRSSAAAAPDNMDGSGELNFYELASIAPDRKISRARDISFLNIELEGVGDVAIDKGVWNKGRQKYKEPMMEIVREKPPFVSGFHRPFKDPGDSFKEHLQAEFNIESDHEEIVRAAEAIVGGERDPLRACRKILDWVYEKLDKRPVVSVPSALEVLRTRMGDCNEHATLTTALLRASGIPARIVVGLVYMRGQFFYHAWTEAYTGQWLSMDATMRQMPVDATHIKLIEGNLDKQVDVAALIGKLKVKIMDYGYD